VEGPDFPEYHGFLGDLYSSIFDQTDDIAEHLRRLDSYAPVSLSRMMELSDIEEDVNIPAPAAMFGNLRRDNDRYIIHLRAGIAAADAAGEPAVSNFLQDILGKHQKHAWMLRSITK
jgi:starvation-inducible DNA-binding protein